MHKTVERILRKILHFLEGAIAIMTLFVMVFMVGFEIYKMATVEGYFADVHNYLHNILTIVVGLEFVRMLIDMTPANTLEVLIVAIARQVIVSHDDPISNICCVVCIAGLFATRHFLIPKKEMTIEMSEVAPDEESQPADPAQISG
ncbi:MAG: hypothetical protein E7438_06045 [Ruminococcaceae bacterium]|nr:hypothetical protein [Oscillospiraceae bacterium]